MKIFIGLLAIVAATVAAPNLGIIGGQDAPIGKYKFAAAIQKCLINTTAGFEWDCEFKCAAIIIGKTVGLTSATCATSVGREILDHKLIIGNVSLVDFNPLGDMLEIDRFYIHPDYKSGGASTNDLAVMHVFFDILRPYDSLFGPARVSPGSYKPSGDAMLIGWGSDGNHISKNLKETQVSILPQTECLTALENVDQQYRDAYNTTTNFCTGPLTGVNVTCDLDTGGILFQDGHVIGLVSWTVSPCGQPGVPSVFTTLSKYVHWLNTFL